MRVSIFFFATLFVLVSCKRLGKESPSMPTAATSISFEDSIPQKEQQPKSDVHFDLKLDSLKTIELPIGSELLASHQFPKKFGLDGEAYLDYFDGEREADLQTKSLSKIVNQNRSYFTSNTLDTAYLKGALEFNYFYKLVLKDTIFNRRNIKTIGKITHGENHFVLCSIVHNTVPLYASIVLCSIDGNDRIKDALVLFDEQEESLSRTNELFFINRNFVITKKYFTGFEGITHFEREAFFAVNDEGHFIGYYNTNGAYESDMEQGVVKNNTREGPWIDKKKLEIQISGYGAYGFVESNYSNKQAVGTWNYYELKYDQDIDGDPIFKTATKGTLLYTEEYKNGKLLKREFVKE